jgi:hypothetical protein
MATLKVYRYLFYDSLLKHDRMSVDFATADVITQKRGTILGETERAVEEGLVGEDGMVRAIDMPPREVVEEPWMRVGGSRAIARPARRP